MNLNKLDSFRINHNYVNKKYSIIKIINLKRNLPHAEFSNALDISSTGTHPNCLCIFSDLARKLQKWHEMIQEFVCVLNGFLGRVRTGYNCNRVILWHCVGIYITLQGPKTIKIVCKWSILWRSVENRFVQILLTLIERQQT